jgi:hypothetical protein
MEMDFGNAIGQSSKLSWEMRMADDFNSLLPERKARDSQAVMAMCDLTSGKWRGNLKRNGHHDRNRERGQFRFALANVHEQTVVHGSGEKMRKDARSKGTTRLASKERSGEF